MDSHGTKAVLFVRLSAIGDVVMASLLISAARQQFPDAHIAWLVQPECAPLVLDHPDLDEVIVWPKSDWQSLFRQRAFTKLWRKIRGFRKQLRARQFDLAIDLQGLLKSGVLARLSGARQRIGLGSREGSQYLMHRVIERGGEPGMIGSEYRYLAETLGWPSDNLRMQIGLALSARKSASQWSERIDAGQEYAVICPFTTRPQKHWFYHHWVELCDRIRNEYHLPVLMLGGPGDTTAARSIASRSSVVDLVGQTSLQEAAALIERAAFVVGVDTGLTHIGHAFDRPTVALFGSTRPYMKTQTPRGQVIYLNLGCSPCKRRPTCNGAFDCMRDITPDQVMARLRPLYEPDASLIPTAEAP